jgi:hypothetical protein
MWREPEYEIFLLKFLNAVDSRWPSGLRDLIFYEGEGDCTSEMGAGQFSIFGAVEEKGGRKFSRNGTDEQTARDESLLHWMALISCAMQVLGKSDGVGYRNVHRVCTGNAERLGSVPRMERRRRFV